MEKTTTSKQDKQLKIGDIFTPHGWARFAIEKFDIFDKWIKGADIFDPTMGSGNLLESIIDYGLSKGYSINQLPVKNLYGNELNKEYHKQALNTFRTKFGVDMSVNFSNQDILSMNPQPFDILLGNPPWQNFVDLPGQYKEKTKPYFTKYDLIENPRKLLLGGSRIDIAALIIQVSINNFLTKEGEAFFFMPLSLLLNDGANEHFRTYKINDVVFAPLKIFDFNKGNIFKKIATRYGLVHFQRDKTPEFPVQYMILNNNNWEPFRAAPLQKPTSPLSIFETDGTRPLDGFKCIKLSSDSKPRQGLNTCGANKIFIFTKYRKLNDTTCIVNDHLKLPARLVFPLLTASNFKNKSTTPQAWVLIPHSVNGKPMKPEEIETFPALKNYLDIHHNILKNRKGTLIASWINKNQWWALLGVGPYNYAPYKIVWEAYGKKKFNPILVNGHWQANQSLQAFMPFQTKEEAERILEKMKDPAIEEYLLSLRMEGTMNWAQPGKIIKLLQFI